MKIFCWVMLFFGFLNKPLAQDVTGTWSLANGHKAEWIQDGQNVYCIYNGGDFKHYLSGRFTSTNQIEAQVVRINLGNNCRTTMAIRYTVSGNSLTESWTANDSNCDLQRGQTGGGVLTRTTPSTRPMNPFGGSAYNPESDLTGAWGDDQGYGDWIQDGRNVYYIFNNGGFKHYFSGVMTGNSTSGTLIRINRQNNCRTTLRATYTKTGTNTLQYTWVANDGNCDITLGQRGEGTITRRGSNNFTLPPRVNFQATQLTGYVDMHTHPMSHLGFGGKLIHGAPDIDILVPAIPSGNGCRHYTRAANINEALCSCNATHGGFGFDNTCGDDLRKAILRSTESQLHARTGHHEEGARGFPAFSGWPAYNDITHQQMWIDWIKRTYQHGLRVMVALTVNNATLAAAVSGPGDRNTDDVSSSNIQIEEMKRMVARHNDWMEIAYTASDIRRIVSANKLAIILGMEVDNIGNFNKNNTIDPNSLTPATTQLVRNEIQRIYNQGVRYIFPIHLVDNKFGGTAVYEDMFNLSNYHQSGRFWDITCANPADGITKKFVVAGFDAPLAAAKAKIGVDAFRNPPNPPNCSGHVNNLGLTPLGEYAIKEMMKMGMMIDIDHMSKKSMDKTLEIANSITGGGYPLNAGHNGIRTNGGSERSLNLAQAQTIMRLGGVIGVGCSKTKSYEFVGNFLSISNQLGGDNARLAIGTDINGFEQGPPPTPGSNLVVYDASFPMCTTGNKSWNYNTVGVAHYGLLPDFFKDVQTTTYGVAVYEKLMKSAEYFAQMWEKCERQKVNVR